MSENVRVLLEFKGDHIPSFKNRKMAIIDRRTGKPRTLTEPKNKKRMEAIIRNFASQLCSGKAIVGLVIPPASLKLSWMLSLLPGDDSNKFLSDLTVSTEWVEKGQEGVSVLIERIQ